MKPEPPEELPFDRVPLDRENRSLAKYEIATLRYDWAISELLRATNAGDHAEYLRLRDLVEESRIECEKMREEILQVRQAIANCVEADRLMDGYKDAVNRHAEAVRRCDRDNSNRIPEALDHALELQRSCREALDAFNEHRKQHRCGGALAQPSSFK